MSVVDNSYNILKAVAINKYESLGSNTINIGSLREHYEPIINSKRTSSLISDVSTLINILEKRGAISPMNINNLYFIFSSLNLSEHFLKEHSVLISTNQKSLLMCEYEEEIKNQLHSQESRERLNDLSNAVPELGAQSMLNRENVNFVSSEDLSRTRYYNGDITTRVNSSVPPGLLSDRIIRMVCSRIGSSWQSLARYLKVVQEGTIDNIEEDRRITSNEERAKMVMDEYLRNIDPPDARRRLLKALRLLNRMDLHNEVEKLLLREN